MRSPNLKHKTENDLFLNDKLLVGVVAQRDLGIVENKQDRKSTWR